MSQTFKPFAYQLPMIDHLLDNDRAALFVSPGKGKTVVTLTAIDALATIGDFKAALIVAPLRVCSITWPAQVERWAHTRWMRARRLRRHLPHQLRTPTQPPASHVPEAERLHLSG
jgi:hypothetical protein